MCQFGRGGGVVKKFREMGQSVPIWSGPNWEGWVCGGGDSFFGFIDHFPFPQNLGRKFWFNFFQLNDVEGKSGQFHGVAEEGKPSFGVQNSLGGDVDIRMFVEMFGLQQRAPLNDSPGPVFLDDHPDDPVEILPRQMEAFHSRPVSGCAAFFQVFFDFLDVQWAALSNRPRTARSRTAFCSAGNKIERDGDKTLIDIQEGVASNKLTTVFRRSSTKLAIPYRSRS